MDKRKYETKTLIAEYRNLSKLEECRFSENAYELKDGSKIIEYDGAGLSIYGTYIAFGKNIGRKGVYSITDNEYKIWKAIRKENKEGYFIDWGKEANEQLEKSWQNQFNELVRKEHENILASITCDELPF